jgi:hypothetical protein
MGKEITYFVSRTQCHSGFLHGTFIIFLCQLCLYLSIAVSLLMHASAYPIHSVISLNRTKNHVVSESNNCMLKFEL